MYLTETGKWDYRKLSSLSEEDLLIFQKYAEKVTRSITKAGQMHGGTAVIYDMDGFTLKNYASRDCKMIVYV